MSRTLIAAISFLAGMSVSTLFGNQSPSAPNRSPGQVISDLRPNGLPRSRISASSAIGYAVPLELSDPVTPRILNINWEPIVEGTRLSGGTMRLDGLDCRKCILDEAHLIYGGGAFNLEGTTFSGTATIEYTGAAANTLAMVQLMHSLGIGEPSIPPPSGQAIKRRTQTKPVPKQTFDFRPPFVSGN